MTKIMLRHGEDAWRPPDMESFMNESELRDILAASPELIPGVSLTALACAEFPTASGPADLVVVDGDGVITLVECKLATNPRMRREIVGQALDYAAALSEMSVDQFDKAWRSRTRSPLLRDGGLGPKRHVLARNLGDAGCRIVLAVDHIDQRLQRTLKYLNTRLGRKDAVTAVEYIRVVEGPLQIVIPRVYEQGGSKARQASIDKPVGPYGSADWRQPRETLEGVVRSLLAEGCSLRVAARLAGTSKSTVGRINKAMADESRAAHGPKGPAS